MASSFETPLMRTRLDASPRSRESHLRASRFFASVGWSSGLLFLNFREYAWLLATPRLKNTSWTPVPTSAERAPAALRAAGTCSR